ncbi:MAG TPA: lipid A biosynthesis acyltransferase [Flavisolibacter sp.]|nr:lipid A biosynthesis acyltransferase [Flavisolibacter sp.]
MPAIMYYFVYGLLYIVSLLPLRILFLFSDLFYFIIYYVIRYRKKVVFYNLGIAFPDKTEKERIKIARQFYKNFTDTFFETIKIISVSVDYINKHFASDYSIFHELKKQGKKCQVHLGHNFNWEMGNLAFASSVKQHYIVVYMPVENKIFDRIFKKIRTRTGAILLPATHLRNAIIPWRNTQYIMALVADQNPAVPSNAFWINFFGKPTPFLKGPESGSKGSDMAVVFGYFIKPKRGYYIAHFELAEENGGSLKKGELTQKYVKYLEKVISAHPEMWLWSHRRWKFEWKPEYGPVLS